MDRTNRTNRTNGRTRGARDVYTASYLRKLTGVREWDIRQHCACRGYDERLRELYSLAEVRRYLLARRQERERRRLELELLHRRGLQLCRKCGAIIKYPGVYYCANPECWPPSLRRRLEDRLRREGAL